MKDIVASPTIFSMINHIFLFFVLQTTRNNRRRMRSTTRAARLLAGRKRTHHSLLQCISVSVPVFMYSCCYYQTSARNAKRLSQQTRSLDNDIVTPTAQQNSCMLRNNNTTLSREQEKHKRPQLSNLLRKSHRASLLARGVQTLLLTPCISTDHNLKIGCK